MKTITGVPIEEVMSKLAELLPPDAYKAVPGASGLTDINPAYLTQKVNDVFGICGFGWVFSFDPKDMVIQSVPKTSKSGREYVDYIATLNYLTIQFAAVDDNGTVVWSQPIPSNGGSSNEDLSYAQRGALTNAIGAAFSKLGWQLGVYMGKIDHNNAAQMWAAKQKKNGSSQAPAKGDKPKDTQQDAPAKDAPAAVDDRAVKAALTAALTTAIVPEGVPLAGKTFGDALQDETFGIAIIKFLTGKFPNMAGNMFNGDQAIKDAAQLVFDNMTLAGQLAAKSAE
jgi:hypothetical protein